MSAQTPADPVPAFEARAITDSGQPAQAWITTRQRHVVILFVLSLPLLASGCIHPELDPSVGINVRNQTEDELTIRYDPPGLDEELDLVVTVLEPGDGDSFDLGAGDGCAEVDVEAINTAGDVVDRLPAGTCHGDEIVRWVIE
ncbi:MAG: hypothetical protein U5R31_08455 [Acidimicrobiia bacterium]|nr:hypothetical protein [Acidimicrobiia bacterium]